MHLKRGLFFDFEGPEGGGKSTLIPKVAHTLREMRQIVTTTREPGGTPVAEELRNILLRKDVAEQPSPRTEALILAAGRSQHVDRLINPRLREGGIVLSDRYFYSTLAYQHYARGLDREYIEMTINLAIDGVIPDTVFLLDIDVKEGLRRKMTAAKARPEEINRLDVEPLTFHEKVRQGYLEMAKEFSNFCVIDATRSEDEVFKEVYAHIKRKIDERNS